jgi:hypothetical protein
MAEQNRKDGSQKALRFRAGEIIDLHIDYLLIDSDQVRIAYEGRCILGTYSEHGELPQGSGFAGFCKLAGKVDRMRVRRTTAQMVIAHEMVSRLDDDYATALCVDRCYRGRTKSVAIDPFQSASPVYILWDDAQCAGHLGITVECMRKRISRGYQMLEAIIQPQQKAA